MKTFKGFMKEGVGTSASVPLDVDVNITNV